MLLIPFPPMDDLIDYFVKKNKKFLTLQQKSAIIATAAIMICKRHFNNVNGCNYRLSKPIGVFRFQYYEESRSKIASVLCLELASNGRHNIDYKFHTEMTLNNLKSNCLLNFIFICFI